MQVVLIILRVRLVTPAFYVQTIARIVRIGLNGVIAVLHVALELKQERSHVLMQAVPIIQKIEHVTQMLLVLKIVKNTVMPRTVPIYTHKLLASPTSDRYLTLGDEHIR